MTVPISPEAARINGPALAGPPGRWFTADGPLYRHLRLAFTPPPERLTAAVTALASG